MNNTHTQRWNRQATITALLAVISLASARPETAALDVDGFPVNTPAVVGQASQPVQDSPGGLSYIPVATI